MLALLAARDGLLLQQKPLDTRCTTIAKADAVCKRLMTIPGVGTLTALAFKAEIDDPTRFRKSRDVGVHIGLTPRKYASGEIDRSGGISKCGNRALRALLFDASITMLTRSKKWSRLKAWGVRLAYATARQQRRLQGGCNRRRLYKLAVIMHRMWVDETNFAYGDVSRHSGGLIIGQSRGRLPGVTLSWRQAQVKRRKRGTGKYELLACRTVRRYCATSGWYLELNQTVS